MISLFEEMVDSIPDDTDELPFFVLPEDFRLEPYVIKSEIGTKEGFNEYNSFALSGYGSVLEGLNTTWIMRQMWTAFSEAYDLGDDPNIYSLDYPIILMFYWALSELNRLLTQEAIDIFDEIECPDDILVKDEDITKTIFNAAIKVLPACFREICEKNKIDDLVEIVKDTTSFEDFSEIASYRKADLFRKWYHTRSLHPQISLEEYQEEYEEANDGAKWDIEDLEHDIQSEAEGNHFVEHFFDRLNEKDQLIMLLRMRDFTYKEIAAVLGYKTHSAVIKRMKKIESEFARYVGSNYNLRSYIKKEYWDSFDFD